MVEFGFSPREREVLEMAATGLSDREIALHCGVTLATIRTYWDRIRLKTAARSRTHAVAIALLARRQGSVDSSKDVATIS